LGSSCRLYDFAYEYFGKTAYGDDDVGRAGLLEDVVYELQITHQTGKASVRERERKKGYRRKEGREKRNAHA
jgi:hypothetical protein